MGLAKKKIEPTNFQATIAMIQHAKGINENHLKTFGLASKMIKKAAMSRRIMKRTWTTNQGIKQLAFSRQAP